MEKIKSITEAFSMQPNTFYVCDPDNRSRYPEKDIQRIDLFEPYQYEWLYIGFNFEGKKLFEYHYKSVNVHFEI